MITIVSPTELQSWLKIELQVASTSSNQVNIEASTGDPVICNINSNLWLHILLMGNKNRSSGLSH